MMDRMMVVMKMNGGKLHLSIILHKVIIKSKLKSQKLMRLTRSTGKYEGALNKRHAFGLM